MKQIQLNNEAPERECGSNSVELPVYKGISYPSTGILYADVDGMCLVNGGAIGLGNMREGKMEYKHLHQLNYSVRSMTWKKKMLRRSYTLRATASYFELEDGCLLLDPERSPLWGPSVRLCSLRN